MATESLSFNIFANDRASETFRKLGLAAEGASGDVKDLGERLTKLGTRVTTARVKLDGNKEANADLDRLDVKLIRLGNKVANPDISVEGKMRALADISAVDLALDRLGRKHVGPSVLHRLSGGMLGSAAGAGITAGGAAGPGGGAAAAAGGGIFSNPVTGIAAAAAGLAALPFAAQAASGAITFALGGALTGIGVLSAAQSKKVRADWSGLFTQTKGELRQVTKPFEGALKQISQVAQSVLPSVMESLVGPMKILASSFKVFSDALLRAFAQPAVANSLRAVAGAFGSILKALAPQLAGDIADVATGITKIAKAVSANPQALADFVSFLFKVAGGALTAIAWLTRVANVIEQKLIPNMVLGFAQMGHLIRDDFDKLRHQTAVIFDGIRHDTAHIWDQIFENSVGMVIRLVHNIETQYNSLRHGIASLFDGIRHDIASAWNTIWNNTVGQVRNGINTVVAWFRGLPGRVASALLGLGTKLWNLGKTWLTDLWNGLKSVAGGVVNWFTSLPSKLLHAIGIASPPDWAIMAGRHIMGGILHGITSRKTELQNAFRGSVALGGDALANQALARRIFPWGGSQWGPFVELVMAESGFNRFARNPSSGAYGIAQALPESKYPLAGQAAGGSHAGAQLSWMFQYIAQRYGTPAGAWAHELSSHWYDRGGWLPVGASIAVNTTGRPERVGGGAGNTYNINIPPGIAQNPREVGRQVVEVIRQYEKGSGAGWRR